VKNSRQKGSVAEREVAKLVQEWWSCVEPDCEFTKTPLSGGWSGPRVREAFQAAADLMTTAKQWPWAVEVKRREKWSLENVLTGKRSPVWGWWKQCVDAAALMHKRPMLWFRKSREPWQVMIAEFDMRVAARRMRAQFTQNTFGLTKVWSREDLCSVNETRSHPCLISKDSLLSNNPVLFLDDSLERGKPLGDVFEELIESPRTGPRQSRQP